MNVFSRRAPVLAALVAIAGCSTTASQTSLPSAGAYTFVHRGVPFVPSLRTTHPVRYSISRTYSTKGSLIFEGDQSQGQTNVYTTKGITSNSAPIASMKASTGCPYGIAADKKGTIYVADNCAVGDVEEFPKGSTTMSKAITDGISYPLGLAMDKSQTLYVSNYPAAITEYAYGTTSPSKTVTDSQLKDPFGLALDKSGNLYIADFGASAVFELPKGGSGVTNLGLQDLTEPIGVAVDQKHNLLWVTDGQGDKINVYKLGSTSPIETISGQGFPYAISLQESGKPKGEVVYSDLGTETIYAFKPGSYTPYASFNSGVSLPTGLLIAHP